MRALISRTEGSAHEDLLVRIDRAKRTDALPFLVAFFFVLTFAIKAFTDGPYVRGELSSAVVYSKYFTAAAACVLAVIEKALVPHARRVFVVPTRNLLLVALVFLGGSLWMAGDSLLPSDHVMRELVKLAMPVVLTFTVVNVLDARNLHRCMTWILGLCLAGYVHELLVQGVDPTEVFRASYANSTSVTENSGFAEIFLMLTVYFSATDRAKGRVVLSALACVLTFKRLGLLVALTCLVVVCVFPAFGRMRVPRWVSWCGAALTILATMWWYWLLLPEQEELFFRLLGKTPGEFTSGRSTVMRYLLESGFHSWGFGSASEQSLAVFGVIFEMDFIKVLLELGMVALVVLVCGLWSLVGSSAWALIIVSYYSINMITSDSLSTNFAMTLALISIAVSRGEVLTRPSPRGELSPGLSFPHPVLGGGKQRP